MSPTTPTLAQLANEAEFQMSAVKDQLEWFAAIARAIARDVEHGGGRDVRVLAQLANYLDATGSPGTDAAIEMFKKIADQSAPRSAQSENVARNASAGGAQ